MGDAADADTDDALIRSFSRSGDRPSEAEVTSAVRVAFKVLLATGLSSVVLALGMGMEGWRAAVAVVIFGLLALLLNVRGLRRARGASFGDFFFVLLTGAWCAVLLYGSLRSPWLATLATAPAAAAALLPARAALVAIAGSLVVLGVVVGIDADGFALSHAPAFVDREHAGPGRVIGVVAFFSLILNSTMSTHRFITGLQVKRVQEIEALARQEELASIDSRSRVVDDLTRALHGGVQAPLARARERLARLLPAHSGADLEHLQVLSDETERFARLVSSAAHLVGADEAANVDVVDTVRGVVRANAAVAERAGVTVTVTGAGTAHAPPVALRQIVMNLLQNAIAAAPPSSAVEVVVEGAGADVVVFVSDLGGGLSEAARARLFQPGFTTRSDGSGLGLVVARTLAERAGGSLSLDNRAGGGCCARLTLPAATSPSSSPSTRVLDP